MKRCLTLFSFTYYNYNINRLVSISRFFHRFEDSREQWKNIDSLVIFKSIVFDWK